MSRDALRRPERKDGRKICLVCRNAVHVWRRFNVRLGLVGFFVLWLLGDHPPMPGAVPLNVLRCFGSVNSSAEPTLLTGLSELIWKPSALNMSAISRVVRDDPLRRRTRTHASPIPAGRAGGRADGA